MKKLYFTIGICVLSLAIATNARAGDFTWALKAPMQQSRSHCASVALNGKIYAIGGYVGGHSGTASVEEYDPVTDTWNQKAPISNAVWGLRAAVVNGKIYVFGGANNPGGNSTHFSTVEEYDPAANRWTLKSPMSEAKYNMAIAVFDDKIYIIGGTRGDIAFDTIDVYDPLTDTWTTKTPMPFQRHIQYFAQLGDKVYLFGNPTYVYDIATESWSQRAAPPFDNVLGPAAAAMNGKIYVFGGGTGPVGIPDVWEYAPSTDTWSAKTAMITGVSHLWQAASVVGNKVYVLGGQTAYPTQSTTLVQEGSFLPVCGASFRGLGDLPGGNFESYASGVSDDGSVVVGYSFSISGWREAFRWTDSEGMLPLGDLPGGSFESAAIDVSSDGSTLVGYGSPASGQEAFRWTQETGMVGLGRLGGHNASVGIGVSPNGSVVVGASSIIGVGPGTQALRWEEATGLHVLPDLPGGGIYNAGYGFSGDGSIIVGHADGGRTAHFEACKWTRTEGGDYIVSGLGPTGVAYTASYDGSVIVGYMVDFSGQQAFRWTQSVGLVPLGDLDGGPVESHADDVTADGSVIVGIGRSAFGYEAIIWDEANGMRRLSDVLTELGLDVTGWTLTEARGISADGLTIVGSGVNPQGHPEAWIVKLCGVLPPPPKVYYVDAVNGNDNNNGLTRRTAFATIHKGIDSSRNSFKVLVYPGVYREEVDFKGKAITIQGVATKAGIPVIENPGDFAVSFYNGEGPRSILKNFVIRDSFMGIFIAGSSPSIKNLTIVDNKYGIEAYAGSEPDISNCIFWNNSDSDLFGCEARYSCTSQPGRGNIDADPCFADPNKGDYHLLSQRGRYWPRPDVWVLDKVTSPCIDGGDPMDDVLDEPMPNGRRIDMGAFGGTPFASMSEIKWLDGDVNHDGVVNFIDLAMLAENWLKGE